MKRGHQNFFPAGFPFYPGALNEGSQFQEVKFGALRALRITEGGRRAEDPFRGLRAGPARSSPRPFSEPAFFLDRSFQREHFSKFVPQDLRIVNRYGREGASWHARDSVPLNHPPGTTRRRFTAGGAVSLGWGGRIRTFTIRINSAVSYRLDHAPVNAHSNKP